MRTSVALGSKIDTLEQHATSPVTHTSTPLPPIPTGAVSKLSPPNLSPRLCCSKAKLCNSFAPAPEIAEYFQNVAARYKLYDHIHLNAKVTSAIWDDARGGWNLTISDPLSGTVIREATGDIFVNAGGILNAWKWPEIAGLGSFDGPCMHSAAWVRSTIDNT